jgi:hypothetical protein
MATWQDVVERARALPGVTESTSYGTPALKVGTRLMARLRAEAEGAVALVCTMEDKQALVQGDDPAYFTLPHYDGHGYVLVDLAVVDLDELAELLEQAWELRASATLRRQRDSRP